MTITEPDIDILLRDPDPRVRRAAVARVAEDGLRGSGDSLAWLLADSDAGVRRAASAALRDLPEVYLGEEGVQALLLAAARGRDGQVRTTAAELLAMLQDGARELYAQGLHDGEPHLRVQAVLGLIVLQAVADVAEGADDPARDVRVAVAEGLGRLAAPAFTARPPSATVLGAEVEQVLGALDQLITDHDPVVRMAALDAAASLGLPEPLDARAVVATAHSSWQVRRRAVAALGTASPEVAIAPLVAALRDRIVDVRRAAVQSLERWATAEPEAVTALTESLNDPDPGVRTQARWALA